jgi:hypothetical protein
LRDEVFDTLNPGPVTIRVRSGKLEDTGFAFLAPMRFQVFVHGIDVVKSAGDTSGDEEPYLVAFMQDMDDIQSAALVTAPCDGTGKGETCIPRYSGFIAQTECSIQDDYSDANGEKEWVKSTKTKDRAARQGKGHLLYDGMPLRGIYGGYQIWESDFGDGAERPINGLKRQSADFLKDFRKQYERRRDCQAGAAPLYSAFAEIGGILRNDKWDEGSRDDLYANGTFTKKDSPSKEANFSHADLVRLTQKGRAFFEKTKHEDVIGEQGWMWRLVYSIARKNPWAALEKGENEPAFSNAYRIDDAREVARKIKKYETAGAGQGLEKSGEADLQKQLSTYWTTCCGTTGKRAGLYYKPFEWLEKKTGVEMSYEMWKSNAVLKTDADRRDFNSFVENYWPREAKILKHFLERLVLDEKAYRQFDERGFKDVCAWYAVTQANAASGATGKAAGTETCEAQKDACRAWGRLAGAPVGLLKLDKVERDRQGNPINPYRASYQEKERSCEAKSSRHYFDDDDCACKKHTTFWDFVSNLAKTLIKVAKFVNTWVLPVVEFAMSGGLATVLHQLAERGLEFAVEYAVNYAIEKGTEWAVNKLKEETVGRLQKWVEKKIERVSERVQRALFGEKGMPFMERILSDNVGSVLGDEEFLEKLADPGKSFQQWADEMAGRVDSLPAELERRAKRLKKAADGYIARVRGLPTMLGVELRKATTKYARLIEEAPKAFEAVEAVVAREVAALQDAAGFAALEGRIAKAGAEIKEVYLRDALRTLDVGRQTVGLGAFGETMNAYMRMVGSAGDVVEFAKARARVALRAAGVQRAFSWVKAEAANAWGPVGAKAKAVVRHLEEQIAAFGNAEFAASVRGIETHFVAKRDDIAKAGVRGIAAVKQALSAKTFLEVRSLRAALKESGEPGPAIEQAVGLFKGYVSHRVEFLAKTLAR